MIYTPLEIRSVLQGRLYRNENGDGGMGGSMGSNDSGGFGDGGGFSGYSGQSSLGTSNPGFADGGFNSYGGQSMAGTSGSGMGFSDGLGSVGNDGVSPMDFNPAFDSQLANMDLGLGPNSDFSGSVNLGQENSGLAGMFSEQGLRRGLGMVAGAISPMAGLAVNGVNAAQSSNPGKGFGSLAGGLIGGILGGPLGGMAGSQIGSGLSGTGASTADAAAGVANGRSAGMGDTGFNAGDFMSGLGGLYSSYQNTQNANNAQGVAQQQTDSLANMYGPNSPYAAQLREQLSRKDAASGRNSQYGPREVELQAQLAGMATKNAPNVLAANQAAYTMGQNGQRSIGQGLSTAMSLANKTGLTGYAQKALGNMFGSGDTNFGANGNFSNFGGMSTPATTNPGFGEGGFSNYGGQSVAPTSTGSGGNFWDNW